ncbi:VanZ family protein [Blastopirellula marina]|uniref:VanZ-like domain-containing protein n=1 Tax=Blastopirellula marina TaxID=124 RepID=A0A2S8GB65_9BACT|nr:VanZ family protein [Blastopirellula marina]PQO41695.1 hypothetical protein C5Y98_02945 [Blastopirellula marina]PTL46138.1 VanZ family protein [Blastopirellula marina]
MLPRVSPSLSTAILIGLCLLAFLGTHWPLPHKLISQSNDLVPQFDKYVHATIYAVLAMAALLMIGSWKFRWSFSLVVVVWVTLVAWGSFDELTQMLVAGRSCDPADLVADAVGASLGIGAMAWVRHRSVEQWLLPSETRT